MRRWTALFVGLMVVIGVGKVQAAITVTSDWSPPSTDVLVSHPYSQSNYSWPWNWVGDRGEPDWEHTDMGQSFLISAPYDVWVEKITVKLSWTGYGSGAPNADYNVELWTTTDWYDWNGNTLVNQQSGTLPVGLDGAHSYWTFDIEDTLLPTGQNYAFMFSFDDGPAAGRSVGLAHTYGPPDYGDGRMMTRTGTPPAWFAVSHDLEFYVQGWVTPEPSTFIIWSLLGGLGITIGWWRRRR